MKSSVQIDPRERIVTKRLTKESLLREVHTTERARDLAKSSRLFRVPRVLEYDLSREWIRLEYIPNAVPLHRVVPRQPVELFARVGAVVALIHRELAINAEHIVSLPKEFDRVGPKSCLHGDLSLYNILYQSASDTLVIVDWSTSPQIGGNGNWGTRYWDVAKFARAAITDPPVRWIGRRLRWNLADAFLSSYQAHWETDALGGPFFNYCLYIHRFLCEKAREGLQWYRYARLAMFNLRNFNDYVACRASRKSSAEEA